MTQLRKATPSSGCPPRTAFRAKAAGLPEVLSMLLSSRGILQIGTTRGLFELNVSKISSGLAPHPTLTGRIAKMREDPEGNLWFLLPDAVARLDAGSGSVRSFSIRNERTSNDPDIGSPFDGDSENATLPDVQGAIWSTTPRGLVRQDWNANGIPGRPTEFPLVSNAREVARVAVLPDGTAGLWQTRREWSRPAGTEACHEFRAADRLPDHRDGACGRRRAMDRGDPRRLGAAAP